MGQSQRARSIYSMEVFLYGPFLYEKLGNIKLARYASIYKVNCEKINVANLCIKFLPLSKGLQFQDFFWKLTEQNFKDITGNNAATSAIRYWKLKEPKSNQGIFHLRSAFFQNSQNISY